MAALSQRELGIANYAAFVSILLRPLARDGGRGKRKTQRRAARIVTVLNLHRPPPRNEFRRKRHKFSVAHHLVDRAALPQEREFAYRSNSRITYPRRPGAIPDKHQMIGSNERKAWRNGGVTKSEAVQQSPHTMSQGDVMQR